MAVGRRSNKRALQKVLGQGANISNANPLEIRIRALDKAVRHSIPVVAATDILTAALAPLNSPCTFRVEAAFDAAGILSVRITRGGVTVTEQFNGGVALNNDSLYRFNHMVHSGDTINFRYSVNANCLSLRCQEIVAAAE